MELYGCHPTPGNKTTVDVFLLLFLHSQTEIVIKKGKKLWQINFKTYQAICYIRISKRRTNLIFRQECPNARAPAFIVYISVLEISFILPKQLTTATTTTTTTSLLNNI